MKKIYLLLSTALLATSIASAQIYSNNFDESVSGGLINEGQFETGQNGSDLIIFSQGHDDYQVVDFYLNEDSSSVSMTSRDTIYIRVKADFDVAINPVLDIRLTDSTGVVPNNDAVNSVNDITLSSEWQVFKFLITDWNNTYGGGDYANQDADSTKISKISFGPNSGFGSDYKPVNSDGETVSTSFEGTIYIDYVSIGSDIEAGNELEVFTSYEHVFTDESLNDITSSASFVNSISDDALVIESAGHDQWESINVPVTDGVVDISSGLELTFEASSSVSSTADAPIGFMIVAVDELGTRIQYSDLFTFSGLTTTPQEVIIDFGGKYEYETETTLQANPKRIASFDILINQGFASEWLSTNDLSQPVDEAYVGTITISNLAFTELVDGVNNKNESLILNFFPNPANDLLHIADLELNGADYSVTDLLGTEVESGELRGESIDVSSLSKGSYVVTLSKNGLVYSSVFIKE